MEQKNPTKGLLLIARVGYGKNDTPVDVREYKLFGNPGSPVGTKSEWTQFAKEQGFCGLTVFEKDQSAETTRF